MQIECVISSELLSSRFLIFVHVVISMVGMFHLLHLTFKWKEAHAWTTVLIVATAIGAALQYIVWSRSYVDPTAIYVVNGVLNSIICTIW